MITVNGVRADERPNSGSISGDRDNIQPKRIFVIPWAKKFDFIDGIMGGRNIIGGDAVYVDPLPYEAGSSIVATSYTLDGLGMPSCDSSGYIQFPEAIITVGFSIPEENQTGGPMSLADVEAWMDEDATYKTELMTVPEMQLWIEDLEKLLPMKWGLELVTGDLTWTRYNVASIDRASLALSCGSTNNATYRGYPAETLLFCGFSPKRKVGATGETSRYTVSALVKHKPTGWNKALYKGEWRTVGMKAPGQAFRKPYPPIDFGTIGNALPVLNTAYISRIFRGATL